MYGTFVNDGSIDSTFSIPFSISEVEDFLFITGDRQKWLVASADAVIGQRDPYSGKLRGYANANRDIKISSISSIPYQATWYNRKNKMEDPWISLTDHSSAVEENNILYGEDNFGLASHTEILRLHNGANVYIRRKGKYLLI